MKKVLEVNYHIEDLAVKGNPQMNFSIKEILIEECRKNLLIKEHIV
jgi:hypothetical protein